MSACESLQDFLPVFDPENLANHLCPIDLATDVYLPDNSSRVEACSDIVLERSHTLTESATSLLFSEINPADLLSCNFPFTVFTEFSRDQEIHGSETMISETSQIWITLEDTRNNPELLEFKDSGLIDSQGNPTSLFPLNAITVSGNHVRPLQEFENDLTDREASRDFHFSTSVLEENAPQSDLNSFSLEWSRDAGSLSGTDCQTLPETWLRFSENGVLDDSEKLLFDSAECLDYSLATVSNSLPETLNPLLETAADFCGIEKDFRGTKRCVKYFGTE